MVCGWCSREQRFAVESWSVSLLFLFAFFPSPLSSTWPEKNSTNGYRQWVLWEKRDWEEGEGVLGRRQGDEGSEADEEGR